MSVAIRPEIRAALMRFREALAGGAAVVLGLWVGLGTFGITAWLGWALAMAGLAAIAAGLQRARFRTGSGGPGVVQIDEGQIAYFGPLTGGLAALSEIRRLSLDRSATPAHWIISQPGREDLAIPVTAEGADALFDAFTALPGLGTRTMLAALERGGGGSEVIWQAEGAAPVLRLH